MTTALHIELARNRRADALRAGRRRSLVAILRGRRHRRAGLGRPAGDPARAARGPVLFPHDLTG